MFSSYLWGLMLPSAEWVSAGVVEDLDVFEDRDPRVVAALEGVALDRLDLEVAKKLSVRALS